MKVLLKPLYSKLNAGVGHCPLGCESFCRVREAAIALEPPPGYTCPLSSHQAQTAAAVMSGDADVIFNKSATGDGKTLSGSLPSLLDVRFRLMALYPTIELVEDQTQQQTRYHELFGLDAEGRIDRLFGEELNRRVREDDSSKFEALLIAIYHKPILLTNPDIFHFITHYRYRQPASDRSLLPLVLAQWPDLWMFDEFHIFGPHQEAAALNSLTLIRRTQQHQRPRRFLFTSATPKPEFIDRLRQAEFAIAEISGIYASEATSGYRQILQAIALEFVQLGEGDAVQWLTEAAQTIRMELETESAGRGLIILNAIAAVNRVVRQLRERLPGILVREISGRIDRQTRSQIQAELQDAPQPVLIVATSAVDVGVDFRIHLLIFEGSDAATVIQRLGRLGRHPGFSSYRAFVLISSRTNWVMARLQEAIATEEAIDRERLQAAIAEAFELPKAFAEYSQRWGALQAQGMLTAMSQESAKVSEEVRDRMTEDFERLYPGKLESARKQWFAIGYDPVGKATQRELLRFRGGTAIQAAVWDEERFYTYDLLRLLPYARVEICDRETFIAAATAANCSEEAFDDKYIHVYLRVVEWVEERISLSLQTSRDSVQACQLSLCDRVMIIGHPQPDVKKCLQRRKLLAFLVPVNRSQPSSHWQVSYKVQLPLTFGLYRLTDASEQAYACAFNQDALLLEALKWRLHKFCRAQSKAIVF